MYKDRFCTLLWACGLMCFTNMQAQKAIAFDKFEVNKKGFFAGAAFIYNYTKPSVFTLERTGLAVITNSNPDDSLYQVKARNRSTGTFGLYIGFNKPFSRKWSFSIGLEVDQRTQMTEYFLYEDAKLSAPEPVSQLTSRYAMFVPLRINYFAGRFIISAGNNLGFVSGGSMLTKYNDGSESRKRDGKHGVELSLHETLSYQVLRDKRIYLQLSAGQSPEFYESSGYNNVFMAGGAYYF